MKPALTPTAAEKVTALRTVQFPSISANRWMKIFRSVMGITRHGPNGWSRKKADEACELVNQFADELVAKIRAINDDSGVLTVTLAPPLLATAR